MDITLLVVGKTTEKYLKEGMDIYLRRLDKYVKFKIIEIQPLKNTSGLSIEQIKEKESAIIEKNLTCNNVVLLDERGKQMTSEEFADFLQNYMNRGAKCLTFVIGGSYGFSDKLRKKYPLMALSKMTFAHQMVRLFFVEQLYRAFTILKSEPYHH